MAGSVQVDRSADVSSASLSEDELSRAFLAATAAMVCSFDGGGRILMANRAFERFTGLTAAELIGRHIWDVHIVAEDVPTARLDVADALAGRESFSREGDWVTGDGTRRRIGMQIDVLRDAHGAPATPRAREVGLMARMGCGTTGRSMTSSAVNGFPGAPAGDAAHLRRPRSDPHPVGARLLGSRPVPDGAMRMHEMGDH